MTVRLQRILQQALLLLWRLLMLPVFSSSSSYGYVHRRHQHHQND